MQDTALAAVLRRDRWIVVFALLAISGLALGYTWWLATGFDMSGMMSPGYVPWSRGYFTFMLVMWIVMMIGMMTPSVALMILLYAAIARQNSVRRDAARMRSRRRAGSSRATCWPGPHSLPLATLLQWLLEWQRAGDPDDGGYQPRTRGHRAHRRRRLSMVAGQIRLPGFLPRTAVIRAAAWWIPDHRSRIRCGSVSCTASTASAAAGY